MTKVLLVSGSLRAKSVNRAVLRTAAALAGDGIRTTLYGGMGTLPHFNPDEDPDGGPVRAAVADLRQRLADADAVLFSAPEYAGSLPGSFKNLLDWTVGGGETYGMPVAWINASSRLGPDAGRARTRRFARFSATPARRSPKPRADGSGYREPQSEPTG